MRYLITVLLVACTVGGPREAQLRDSTCGEAPDTIEVWDYGIDGAECVAYEDDGVEGIYCQIETLTHLHLIFIIGDDLTWYVVGERQNCRHRYDICS